jgi:hypothetical protein
MPKAVADARADGDAYKTPAPIADMDAAPKVSRERYTPNGNERWSRPTQSLRDNGMCRDAAEILVREQITLVAFSFHGRRAQSPNRK